MFANISVRTHQCKHTSAYAHIIVRTHLCTHTLVYAHISVCAHLCKHTSAYAHIIVRIHLCTHTSVYAQTHPYQKRRAKKKSAFNQNSPSPPIPLPQGIKVSQFLNFRSRPTKAHRNMLYCRLSNNQRHPMNRLNVIVCNKLNFSCFLTTASAKCYDNRQTDRHYVPLLMQYGSLLHFVCILVKLPWWWQQQRLKYVANK